MSANRDKISAYLQLVRLPNIFTAMADVMAGYLMVAASAWQLKVMAGLLLSTSLIYGAGCVLNDICDRDLDARERPSRPIPSGRVAVKEAKAVTTVMLALGVLAALFAGWQAAILAIPLVALVIAYDCVTKEMLFWGSITMGGCRALNLMLGMSPALIWDYTLIFPCLSLIYVAAVTLLSKFEVDNQPGNNILFVFGGASAVFFALTVLMFKGSMRLDSLFYLVLLLVLILPGLLKCQGPAPPATVGRAVKFMILAIPLLDAAYVSGVQGFYYGVPVALCLAPAILIGRFLYVT